MVRFAAIWTALGLLFAAQVFVDAVYLGQPLSWPQAIGIGLLGWYLWAVFFVPLFALARRFPFERDRWVRSLLVHLPLTFVATLVKLALESVLVRVIGMGRIPSPGGLGKLQAALLTCWLISGVCHAFLHYQSAQERRERALALESQLSQARLTLLRNQLHPHFLFNTLHAISTLMHRDVDAAEQMLARLSDLLRLALNSSEEQEVTLCRELHFVRLYLQIQQIRFQDRLRVEIDTSDEVMEAQVPNMILQPLVENAVQYGVANQTGAARIDVGASRQGGKLELTVRNNGPHFQGGNGEGVGLRNTRQRLRQLYGDRQELSLQPMDGGGVEVALLLPFYLDPMFGEGLSP